MSERKPGWYWVKWGENDWEPVRATGLGYWASYVGVHEREPDEIGPRIPTPDEPWQCVPVESTPLMASVAEDHIEAGHDAATIWRAMLMYVPRRKSV